MLLRGMAVGACAYLCQYRYRKGEMLTHGWLAFFISQFLFRSKHEAWVGTNHIQDEHSVFNQTLPKLSSQTHPKLCLPEDFKSSQVQKENNSSKYVTRINVRLALSFLTLEPSLYLYKIFKYIYNLLWIENNNPCLCFMS